MFFFEKFLWGAASLFASIQLYRQPLHGNEGKNRILRSPLSFASLKETGMTQWFEAVLSMGGGGPEVPVPARISLEEMFGPQQDVRRLLAQPKITGLENHCFRTPRVYTNTIFHDHIKASRFWIAWAEQSGFNFRSCSFSLRFSPFYLHTQFLSFQRRMYCICFPHHDTTNNFLQKNALFRYLTR